MGIIKNQKSKIRNYLVLIAVALLTVSLCILYNVLNFSNSFPEAANIEPDTVCLQTEASLTVQEMSMPEPEPKPGKINPQLSNLTNILDLDNTFLVDMKYATTDNFTGMALYEDIDGAYLQPDVALMLVKAHQYMKELRPDAGLRLLVYDAARPLSVQRIMYERVQNTPYHRYVAHPDRHSLHNYGAAVDVTIADSLGQPLDMGTPFDHFGRAAGIGNEEQLIQQGLLTRQHVQNRQFLRQVMRHAGFIPISGEWWHFNACSLQEARRRYSIIE